MNDRVAHLNAELGETWGEALGLKRQAGTSGVYSIKSLIRKNTQQEVFANLESDFNLERALFDHARHFAVRSGASTAVIVTAPYLNAVLGHFGTSGAANKRIHEIAHSLGLNVRIGNPKDTIYLSNIDNDPTLTIVWWNPERFDLPFPEVDDPNSRFLASPTTP